MPKSCIYGVVLRLDGSDAVVLWNLLDDNKDSNESAIKWLIHTAKRQLEAQIPELRSNQ